MVHWLTPGKKTAQQMGEAIVVEQFCHVVGAETQAWIRRHNPDTLEEAVKLAEDFEDSLTSARIGILSAPALRRGCFRSVERERGEQELNASKTQVRRGYYSFCFSIFFVCGEEEGEKEHGRKKRKGGGRGKEKRQQPQPQLCKRWWSRVPSQLGPPDWAAEQEQWRAEGAPMCEACGEFGHDRGDCPYGDPQYEEAWNQGLVGDAAEWFWAVDQTRPSPAHQRKEHERPQPKKREPERPQTKRGKPECPPLKPAPAEEECPLIPPPSPEEISWEAILRMVEASCWCPICRERGHSPLNCPLPPVRDLRVPPPPAEEACLLVSPAAFRTFTTFLTTATTFATRRGGRPVAFAARRGGTPAAFAARRGGSPAAFAA
ncbi:UNVERIFIED_CONTAM: hypothetical protein FKN15_001819 [Acipenser sinensis]